MEVTLQAYQCGHLLLEAKFIMVSISADGKGKAPIVPLQITNEADHEMFLKGEGFNANNIINIIHRKFELQICLKKSLIGKRHNCFFDTNFCQ